MGLLIIAGLMLFSASESEFIKTSNEQIGDGFMWSYVGKQEPSGAPALTIQPDNGDDYILWRLTK